MDSPFFSVIVPVYKVERYLRKCVESILCQSYTDFELILVDDGSPDHSGAICDEYAEKDNRVTVIHKPNGGVSSVRNAGLQRAAGTYVVFCDGDDSLKENYLKEMHRLMHKSGADMAVCGFESVNDQGEPVQGRRSGDCSSDSVVQQLDNDLFWKLFEGRRIGSCFDKAFRMDIIRRDSVEFQPGVAFAEDADFVLRYLYSAGAGCSVTVTDERLYLYLTQEHDSAVQKLRSDRWQMFERLFPMLERYVSAENHQEALQAYICSAIYFVMDGLLRYDGIVPYARFRESTADMLRSGYFRDAVISPQMKEYNRLLVTALKSGSVTLVWCVYLIWKAKGFLLRR